MFVEVVTMIFACFLVCIQISPFQVNIYRVIKFPFQVFIRFHFMDAQQVHDFQDAMGHTATTRYRYFYWRKFEPEIGMH